MFTCLQVPRPPHQQSIYLLSTEGTIQFRPKEFSSIFINLSNHVTSKACRSDLWQASAVTDEYSGRANDKPVTFGILVHEQPYLNQGHRIQSYENSDRITYDKFRILGRIAGYKKHVAHTSLNLLHP